MCHYPPFIRKGDIIAHHVRTGGLSTKCSDYETVPLCSFQARGCHEKVEQRRDIPEKFYEVMAQIRRLWAKQGGTFK